MNQSLISFFKCIQKHWLACFFGLIWFGAAGFITTPLVATVYKAPFPIGFYLAGGAIGGFLGFIFTPIFIHSLRKKYSILPPSFFGFVGASIAILCFSSFYGIIDYFHYPSGSILIGIAVYFFGAMIFFGFIILPIGITSGIVFDLILRKTIHTHH